MMKRYDCLTLFPEMIEAVLGQSIIGRAQQQGLLCVRGINIRDFTHDKHRHVDDAPYGGGAGMVMQPGPIYEAFQSVASSEEKKPRLVYLSPQGRVFNQQIARELAEEEHLVFLCGHYEGVDERVIEEIVDEELSIGDFVMTGGEIAAIAVIDAVARLVPGVLASAESFMEESHYRGLLEYPQYTRPPEFRGRVVPEVLMSGHHGKIDRWRREQSLIRTLIKRPDMLEKAELPEADLNFLKTYRASLEKEGIICYDEDII